MNDPLSQFLARADALLHRLDAWLPPAAKAIDWQRVQAARWQRQYNHSVLLPVTEPKAVAWKQLRGIDEQKAELDRNTKQFVSGLPANNALLSGSRGCGKSSLVKAMLARHARQGLRLIEVERADLVHLPEIAEAIAGQPYRFIVFCDDLSFEADDPAYKALKAVLDGSIAGAPDNMLIYATSNRRHLMPEFFSENEEATRKGGEVHPGESVEEKLSLADRFGLWLSFFPFDQDAYLDIVESWVVALGGSVDEAMRSEALQWAIFRGGRSGRVARQFAADWVGRQGLKK
ncbi:MAG: ATP-binding protein [Hydrogenophilaceae bacterium]|nr:ATP-binding protein [Hydrogenophilaceae bacterium]